VLGQEPHLLGCLARQVLVLAVQRVAQRAGQLGQLAEALALAHEGVGQLLGRGPLAGLDRLVGRRLGEGSGEVLVHMEVELGGLGGVGQQLLQLSGRAVTGEHQVVVALLGQDPQRLKAGHRFRHGRQWNDG
jgi:hypothetical protein